MAIHPIDQLGMDETVSDDEDLEAALELRAERAEVLIAPKLAYKEADDAAKARIKETVAVGSTVRVGRFRVTHSEVPPRHVEFDTEASTKVGIDAGE